MSGGDRRPRRILIGAGSFADARGAIRLAEQLAEAAAGLGGMLIEETVLAEMAGLPGQRVVTAGGRLVAAPTLGQMRRLIESDAEEFRRSLAAIARAKTVEWSFELRSGELVSGLCAAAAGWDLLLLGHRELGRRTGHVVLVTPAEDAAQDAAELAGELARQLRTDVVTLSLGPESLEGAEAGRVADEDALMARIGRLNSAAVVLDLSAGPLHTPDQLRRILAASRCPVVVLGAGAARGD